LKKAPTSLTKAPTAFDESSYYFSKLRFPRRKRNQIFSDVEDQTMLQPQSILRKMALIPIIRKKAIKEIIKERKTNDTKNLTWFGIQCVCLHPQLH